MKLSTIWLLWVVWSSSFHGITFFPILAIGSPDCKLCVAGTLCCSFCTYFPVCCDLNFMWSSWEHQKLKMYRNSSSIKAAHNTSRQGLHKHKPKGLIHLPNLYGDKADKSAETPSSHWTKYLDQLQCFVTTEVHVKKS